MKKQANMFFTLAALLTLTSFAPKTFWQEEASISNRLPASLEDKEMIFPLESDKAIDEPIFKQDNRSDIEKLPETQQMFKGSKPLEPISIKEFEHKPIPVDKITQEALEKLPEIKVAQVEKLEVKTVEVKKEEKKEDKKEDKKEEAKKEESEQVVCKAEEPDLKKEIDDLVKRNEKLIAELDEVKKDKKEKKERRDKFEANLPKYSYQEFKESDYNSNYMSMMMMSQMTAMMYSQQQQNADIMSQMFSLMSSNMSAQQQRPQYARSFFPSQESFHQLRPLTLSDYQIGVGYEQYPVVQMNMQDRQRNPSAQNSEQHQVQPVNNNVYNIYNGEYGAMKAHEPQLTNPVPHNGFNFGSGTDLNASNDLSRIMFNE
ncbi:MAG: hypothetical protein K2Q18_09960 [Bdellovibrionales bacterium]|nr:hypothetical protein [Bdellovibrionales bacterium]